MILVELSDKKSLTFVHLPSPQRARTHTRERARMCMYADRKKSREGFNNRPVEYVLSESWFYWFSYTNIIVLSINLAVGLSYLKSLKVPWVASDSSCIK